MRFHFLLLSLALGGTAAGCSDTPTTSRFCDVVKRIEATADPMEDTAVFARPDVLQSALELRVRAYQDLARVAPADISLDALTVAAQLSRITSAFSAAGFKSDAANTPAITALAQDAGFAKASSSLVRFSTANCSDTRDV